MTPRLIMAIFSTLLEEIAIVVIALWGLPQLGISIPLAGLITIMVVWGVISVAMYRVGSQALGRKPLIGLPDMIGSRGKAINLLAPSGMVRIKSELWEAVSDDGEIEAGEEISVVGQEALKLTVRKAGSREQG